MTNIITTVVTAAANTSMSEHDGCGCDCDECEHDCGDDSFEDFLTVQCPFCQEIFFLERAEYEDNVECPLCGHTVAVLDNIVENEDI